MKASKASYAIAAGLGCALTVAFIWWLGETDRATPTPYADFERDLAAHKVTMLEIDGTTYRYRLYHDETAHKTTGPNATLASIAAMRSPDAPGPKVRCAR